MKFGASIYYARTTLTSIQTGRQTSDYLKIFSLTSLIFFPITLLCSAWGMNVPVPWQADLVEADDSRYFFFLMLVSLIILLFQHFLFKQINWY